MKQKVFMAGSIVNPNVEIPAPPPPAPPRTSRTYMWVAPVVSFAVLVGFFIMLGFLLTAQFDLQKANANTSVAAGPSPGANTDTQKAAPSPSNATNPPNPSPTQTPSAATAQQATINGSPGGLQNVLFTLLGALGAAFTQVVNFWLGSSKGSSDKTDLLAPQAPAPAPK